jgi:hypothetical protein
MLQPGACSLIVRVMEGLYMKNNDRTRVIWYVVALDYSCTCLAPYLTVYLGNEERTGCERKPRPEPTRKSLLGQGNVTEKDGLRQPRLYVMRLARKSLTDYLLAWTSYWRVGHDVQSLTSIIHSWP